MKFSMVAVVVSSVVFASAGCKKKPVDGGAGSGSAAGSAMMTSGSAAGSGTAVGGGSAASADSGSGSATAATAGGAACASATAYKSPAGAFCIDAAGYTATEKTTGTDVLVSFKKDANTFAVSVSNDPRHTLYNAMVDGIASRSTDPATVIEKGDVAGVTGKILVSDVGKGQAQTLQVVIQGNSHSYACGGENYMPKVDPSILAACKSIRPAE